MNILASIRNLLVSNPAVSSIVGTRVHAMTLPINSTLPAISLSRLPGTKPLDYPLDTLTYIIQVSCWATNDDYGTLASLEEAVFDCLNTYDGVSKSNDIIEISFKGSSDKQIQETKDYLIPMWFEVNYRGI